MLSLSRKPIVMGIFFPKDFWFNISVGVAKFVIVIGATVYSLVDEISVFVT